MVTVTVTGFVGRDAEKFGKVTTLSVSAGARINGTKTADGKYDYKSEWYNFIAFDNSLSDFKKGDKVTITGTLEYNPYTTKFGEERMSLRFIATSAKKE